MTLKFSTRGIRGYWDSCLCHICEQRLRKLRKKFFRKISLRLLGKIVKIKSAFATLGTRCTSDSFRCYIYNNWPWKPPKKKFSKDSSATSRKIPEYEVGIWHTGNQLYTRRYPILSARLFAANFTLIRYFKYFRWYRQKIFNSCRSGLSVRSTISQICNGI